MDGNQGNSVSLFVLDFDLSTTLNADQLLIKIKAALLKGYKNHFGKNPIKGARTYRLWPSCLIKKSEDL